MIEPNSAPFRPPGWLRNRHVQTLLPALGVVKTPRPSFEREIVPLPDGDSLAADWLRPKPLADDAPLLVVLHGLEGSSDSSYARGVSAAALAQGWPAVVMHFRDCGDHRNRLNRRYHAGETGDIECFLDHVRGKYPGRTLLMVGYSLGGNALLKYLGENGEKAPLTAAVAVSVPFELQKASDSISRGFSKFYRWHLMRNMKRALQRKFTPADAPFDFAAAMLAKDFETFDNLVTAPLHGFRDVEHYYDSQSCRQYLSQIAVPTRILHAVDDPFMSPDMIPKAHELSAHVSLELSKHGGHVGFITGGPLRLRPWLPGRIIASLQRELADTQA
ncbi:MAG: hydrolase [Pseudomonadota bacterium]